MYNERAFDLDLVSHIEQDFERHCEIDEFCFGVPPEEKQAKLDLLEQKLKNWVEFAKQKLPRKKKRISISDRALLLYWRGRLLFITNEIDQAKKILTDTIKLDPSIVRAWITLGEVFIQEEDYFSAKCCFENANRQQKTKLALTHLAKLYRSGKLSRDEEETAFHFQKSIEIAKSALRLDVKDGSLWFSLGNSYVQFFMVVSKDVTDMKQALKAYDMAKKCDLNSFELVPDLHFNVATLHRFLKNYQQAMVSLERAVELADEQVDALQTLKHLICEIEALDKLTKKKCGLKTKKLDKLIGQIHPDMSYSNFTTATFSQLHLESNPSTVIYARLVSVPEQSLPCTFMCIDSEANVFPVSVTDVRYTLPFSQTGSEVVITNPLKKGVFLNREDLHADFEFLQVMSTSNIRIRR